MTDKELLVLAARAAGIPLSFDLNRIDGLTNDYWNPLDDDGDAFRLAVKLTITINNDCISDADYKSTRRAIVLSAAEIGKLL